MPSASGPLYLIEILHQTTTKAVLSLSTIGCILSKFYIKPQLKLAFKIGVKSCILSKFYIKPQQRSSSMAISAVVSYRNSTSNHNWSCCRLRALFVVSYRNSTSNHNRRPRRRGRTGVVSYRNSTSNHNYFAFISESDTVVSYRNSTSNHNCCVNSCRGGLVVSYRNSTSNHNFALNVSSPTVLYLIEILHQTTTLSPDGTISPCCILSKFYIKPQRVTPDYLNYRVVSYRNSTSNHNQLLLALRELPVVSYRNSTSNHNFSVRHKNKI